MSTKTLKLKRHQYPVLLPIQNSDWECTNVFNPAVIYHSGLFHMFYRAQGLDWVSRIGYAVSQDGIQWNRLRQPVLAPHDADESRGVEDPRVTEIDNVFYMTYTAYGSTYYGEGVSPYGGGGILPMIARSRNLISWERIGPIVRGEDDKDHVLFPRQVEGKYVVLHRRRPDVWLGRSRDLLSWPEQEMAPVFGPRSGNDWDCGKVGANGVPIETEHGWLLFYHGTDEQNVYHLGVCLLDLENPERVIRRPKKPVFWPEELWELKGDVPNVVFSNANPVVNGTVYVYYGGGDHVIGLATCRLEELIQFVLHAE